MVRPLGTHALVTGGSRGVGPFIAAALADEGVNVTLAARSTDGLAEAAAAIGDGVSVATVGVDLREQAARVSLVAEAQERLGPIDILVNNAGIETVVPFLELTDEQWTRLVDVNLRGPWLCSQVFCRRAVLEQRPGSIIHIGSIQAAKVLPGRTHYAPAKLALATTTSNRSCIVRTASTGSQTRVSSRSSGVCGNERHKAKTPRSASTRPCPSPSGC